MADDAKQLLKYSIRDEFSDKMTCDMKSKVCRGGSKELYRLIVTSRASPQYMKTDPEHLQIISGIGHTFIRYKDDAFNHFLYIDPTIGQFDSSFDGIFVGDESDLRVIAEKTKAQRYKLDIQDYIGPYLSVERQMMKDAHEVNKSRKSRKSKKSRKSRKSRK